MNTKKLCQKCELYGLGLLAKCIQSIFVELRNRLIDDIKAGVFSEDFGDYNTFGGLVVL